MRVSGAAHMKAQGPNTRVAKCPCQFSCKDPGCMVPIPESTSAGTPAHQHGADHVAAGKDHRNLPRDTPRLTGPKLPPTRRNPCLDLIPVSLQMWNPKMADVHLSAFFDTSKQVPSPESLLGLNKLRWPFWGIPLPRLFCLGSILVSLLRCVAGL